MCDCITVIDKLLADKNGRLVIAFAFHPSSTWPALSVEKLDKKSRVKPPSMVPTFCPFCGEKYPVEGG